MSGKAVLTKERIKRTAEKMFIEKGYNAVTFQRLASVIFDAHNKRGKILYYIRQKIRSLFYHYPQFAVDYKKCIPYLINKNIDGSEDVIPCITLLY